MKIYFYIIVIIFFSNSSFAQVNRQTILPGQQALYKAYVTGKKKDSGKVFYNFKSSAIYFLLPESLDKFDSYEKLLDRSLASQDDLEVIVDINKKTVLSAKSIDIKQK